MKALNLFLLAGICFLSSCATILNTQRQTIRVEASDSCNFIVGRDTILNTDYASVRVERSRDPIEIVAYNDTLTKFYLNESRTSGLIFLNALAPWGVLGAIGDLCNDARWTYKNRTYFDMRSDLPDHLKVEDSSYSWRKNVLKVAPAKLLGMFRPSLELSYERKTAKHWSTEVTGGFIFPGLFSNGQSGSLGGRIGLQERYYLYNATNGLYFALDLSFMRFNYKDRGTFYESDTYSSDTTHYYYDGEDKDFRVAVRQLNITWRIGYQKTFASGFGLDAYLGLGPKYLDVRHFDAPAGMTYYEKKDFFNPVPSSSPGYYWSVAVPFQIKLSWAF